MGARLTRSYRELNINCAVSEVLPAAGQASPGLRPQLSAARTPPRPPSEVRAPGAQAHPGRKSPRLPLPVGLARAESLL